MQTNSNGLKGENEFYFIPFCTTQVQHLKGTFLAYWMLLLIFAAMVAFLLLCLW